MTASCYDTTIGCLHEYMVSCHLVGTSIRHQKPCYHNLEPQEYFSDIAVMIDGSILKNENRRERDTSRTHSQQNHDFLRELSPFFFTRSLRLAYSQSTAQTRPFCELLTPSMSKSFSSENKKRILSSL